MNFQRKGKSCVLLAAIFLFSIRALVAFQLSIPINERMGLPSLISEAHYDPGKIPDFYPRIEPGMYTPHEYYEGEEEGFCHSVRNCPEYDDDEENVGMPQFIPGLGISQLPFAHPPQYASDELQGLTCSMEADCVAQSTVPGNLSEETRNLVIRSSTFTALDIGNLSVLPGLVRLRISYSDLQIITPGAFADQAALETLELEGNDITQILPSTFKELKNLKTLDLSNNDISDITPGMFTGLKKLTELVMGGNHLVNVPNFGFEGLTSLKSLSLEENNITYLAKYAFSGLPNLKTLYLNHNLLAMVPTDALREATSLTKLQLTGNPIVRIARRDFKGVDKLRALSLDMCELEEIAKTAFNNKKIRMLDLSDNNLRNLPNMGRMDRLKTLMLGNNPWECDCDLWTSVKWLRRHGFNAPMPDMICLIPRHLSRRRALELDMVDFCFPPPPELPKNETDEEHTNTEISTLLSTEFVNYGGTDLVTGSGARNEMTYDYTGEYYFPHGGWSKEPYKVSELYTVVDRNPTARTTTTVRQTTEIESEITTLPALSTQQTTENRRAKTTEAVQWKRPDSATTVESQPAKEQTTTSKDFEINQHSTQQVTTNDRIFEDTVDHDEAMLPSWFYIVIAILCVALTLCILSIFAVAMARKKRAKSNRKEKNLRLRPKVAPSKSGTSDNAAPKIVVNLDQNGNSSPKPLSGSVPNGKTVINDSET